MFDKIFPKRFMSDHSSDRNYKKYRKGLNGGIVTPFKKHPGGIVPPFNMTFGGTIAPFKMQLSGTLIFLIFFSHFLGLEFGL